MVNEYLTGQAIDFDISMDGVGTVQLTWAVKVVSIQNYPETKGFLDHESFQETGVTIR